MKSYIPGTIVLVNFPFSDLSLTKKRPALVIANASQRDYILCQITSKDKYKDSTQIVDNDLQRGSLNRTSYVRHKILFTANVRLINRQIAILSSPKTRAVLEHILDLIQEAQKARQND